MHADLWITPEDWVDSLTRQAVVYLTPNGRVRIELPGRASITMPDQAARALVHALLAHYAGKVDFHLIEPSRVEAVDQGLRASLRELDREAMDEDPNNPGEEWVDGWNTAADAFSERPTP